MCPFPGNDHSLQPGKWVDKQYLDYGPLMIAMRGRKWVLEPYAVSVPQGNAKANIFEVPGGFVVPVVYAGDARNVKVILRSKRVVNDKLAVYAIHPGTDKPAAVRAFKGRDNLILDVPGKRGCAMVPDSRCAWEARLCYGADDSAVIRSWEPAGAGKSVTVIIVYLLTNILQGSTRE
jgi:hypothetical protein